MIAKLILRNLIASLLLPTVIVVFAACGQNAFNSSFSADELHETSMQDDAVDAVPDLTAAPEFTLPAINKGTEISLSQFQGQKSVVLVFYRAYW